MADFAVIFDLDGVIVDTARFHYQAWKKIADEMGIPFSQKENDKLRGVSRRESLNLLVGRNLPEDQADPICERKNNYYLEMMNQLTPLDILPGTAELLNSLVTANWKTALASASKNAKGVLEKISLSNSFNVIIDGYDFTRSKPDPQIFCIAASRLGMKPNRCVVFEDAQTGIDAAVASGMCAIGISHGHNISGADLVVDSLCAVSVEILKELINRRFGLSECCC